MTDIRYPFPKAVVFDWDNTLIDSFPVVYDAAVAAYKAFDVTPPTYEELLSWQGFSLRDSFPQVFGDKCCFVVSHGNGTGNLQVGGGYIPNIWNYDRGGYETEIHSNPFERATAAKLADGWRKAAGK